MTTLSKSATNVGRFLRLGARTTRGLLSGGPASEERVGAKVSAREARGCALSNCVLGVGCEALSCAIGGVLGTSLWKCLPLLSAVPLSDLRGGRPGFHSVDGCASCVTLDVILAVDLLLDARSCCSLACARGAFRLRGCKQAHVPATSRWH